MKKLMLLPLLGLIQPAGVARPCDSSDCPATNHSTAPGARPTADAESESAAKKKSAAPVHARPNAPKQIHPARPSHLFM